MKFDSCTSIVLVPFFAVILVGCGQSNQIQGTKNQKKPTRVAEQKPDAHEGWWCVEHGLPEAECSLCNAKVAADFKGKGDWCQEHDRAKSQCFVCDPKLQEKYAALYRAKEGKDPPPLEEEKQESYSKKDSKP
jgi:hypothetical protein